MTWFRIEGRMPQHRKVAPLSDAAFRLHITAGAWSTEEGTDGRVPAPVVGTLTAAPRGKALVSAIQELTSGGLWEPIEGGYQIHDYLQWNMSAAELAERRAVKASAGQAGGKRSGEQRRSKNEAGASLSLKQNASKTQALLDPDPGSDPRPEEKPDGEARAGARDPAQPVDPLMNPEETTLNGPLLRQRALEPNNAVDHLTASLKVPRAVIVAELESFCRYREAGKGMGDKRSFWLKHFRQEVIRRFERGHLKAPGLVEHEANAEAKLAKHRPKTIDEMHEEALNARS